MKVEITLPDLGEDSVQAVTVSSWLVKPGAALGEGDDLLEITTDKAAFCVPAPQPGTLAECLVAEGDEIGVGHAICIFDVKG